MKINRLVWPWTVIVILAAFISMSCAFHSHREIKEKKESSAYLGVDGPSLKKTYAPTIEKSSQTASESYGPRPEEDRKLSHNVAQVREPVVAVYLGPGHYRTLSYIGFYRRLQRENINIRLLSGEGLGGVLSSLFASEVTPARIEWLLFKKDIQSSLFTEDGKASFGDIFYPELPYEAIEETPIKLTIPVYSPDVGKVRFRDRGRLKPVLKSQFLFKKTRSASTTPIDKEFDLHQGIKEAGADIIIVLNVLKNENEQRIGDNNRRFFEAAVQRFHKLSQQEKSDLLYFEVSTEKITDIGTKELPYVIQKGQTAAKRSIPKIKKRIRQWKKDQLESIKP